MFISKRKWKRAVNTSYILSGAALTVGVAGLSIATTTGITHGKKLKELDSNNIEAHIAKCEQTITKHATAIREIQDAMLSSGMMTTR